MNAYDSLRYNEVSMKAAHNSYQRDETLIEQITWNPGRPYNGGCRAIELDIAQSPSGEAWSVGHQESYDRYYRQISVFLSDLLSWSNDNPTHDIITLHLDLKHVNSGFPDQLDKYISSRLSPCGPGKIFSPGYFLSQSSGPLSQAVLNVGWPTLAELKGKFLICLTGNATAKAVYSSTNPAQRLCFTDRDVDQDKVPCSDSAVFFNYHLFWNERSKWSSIFRSVADQPNVVLRGYELDSKDMWNEASASGLNLIATNMINDQSWASVGNEPFVKRRSLG